MSSQPGNEPVEVVSPGRYGAVTAKAGQFAHARQRRRAVATIITGFALLILSGVFEGLIIWQSDRELQALRASWQLHDSAQQVMSLLLAAESGQRGYLIAADPRYLESYTHAGQELPAAMTRLRELASRAPDGSAHVGRITTVVEAKRQELAQTIDLLRNGQRESALGIVGIGIGKDYMDQIRAAIADLERDADSRLRQTSAALDRLRLGLILAVAGAMLAVMVLAALLIRDTRRYFRLLERREGSLNSLASGLERRVAWRTRSLTELNRRFDAALRASGVTVFAQDRELVYSWISKGAFSFPPQGIIGRNDDHVMPPRFRAPIKLLKREVIETGETARTELCVHEADIERWYSLTIEPQRDPAGQITGIVGGAVDITDRKEHETRIHLLMRELNHRSRNLLAVIQAIARQSAATSVSSGDFLDRFGARLQSLAESHDLLVRDNWRGSSMTEIVRSQLGHYSDLIDTQIELQGGPMRVRPDAAQHIGMALHELATNAAKYGALSAEAGKVLIRWSVEADAEGEGRCRLSWQESGGPPVEPPTRRGFGTVVIERAVAQALDGKVTIDYAPAGFSWQLDFPATCLVPHTPAAASTELASA
jgi:two-component sensor histidine kinase/CHASE3 domain sensor protein